MTNDLIKNLPFNKLSAAFETDKMAALLEEASQKGGRESKFTTKKSFSPSSFYIHGNGVCPRYWYFAFKGAEFEYSNTARERANMDSGTAAGERIAKLFENAGILNKAEFKVIHNDPPIFGFGDLAVTWQGEEMIGEVKTTTEQGWLTRQTSMQAPGYQLIQLLIYMRVFNKEKGFFVIENKNTHELLIIPVKMTEANKKLVDYTFQWMRDVKAASVADTLPTRPFTKSSWNCNSCPVQKTCWPELENGKGYNKGSKNDPLPGVVDLPPLAVPK